MDAMQQKSGTQFPRATERQGNFQGQRVESDRRSPSLATLHDTPVELTAARVVAPPPRQTLVTHPLAATDVEVLASAVLEPQTLARDGGGTDSHYV